MMTALLIFFGISGLVTMSIIAGLALAARRPIPSYDSSFARAAFGHASLDNDSHPSEALLAA